MISAIRQYSGFDYFITFVSFLLYSLPVFWVAVLLKQYGAIEINNFINDPTLTSWWPIIIACLAMGLFWMGALGGGKKRRIITFVTATLVTFGTIYYILASGWLQQPTIGVVGVIIIGAGAAVVMTFLSTGLKNKRVLYATLTCAVIGALLYMPLQYLFYYQEMNWLWMFGLLVVALAVAIGVGLAFRGPDPWDTVRTTCFTTLIIAVTIFADRVLQAGASTPRTRRSTTGRSRRSAPRRRTSTAISGSRTSTRSRTCCCRRSPSSSSPSLRTRATRAVRCSRSWGRTTSAPRVPRGSMSAQ